MRTDKLIKNIIDVLSEQQIKLGFMEGKVRLYYPLKSLQIMLDIDNADKIESALKQFQEEASDKLGDIIIERSKDRFCFIIPPEGSRFVHDNIPEDSFIAKLVELISRHCSIEDIFDIFNENSDSVCIREIVNGDFKYLIYFENEIPDDFYYCFNIEGEHIIYHRYTKSDYEDMFG